MLGIIRTDRWMNEHFFEPEKICEKITRESRNHGTGLYQFLQEKGMYRPNVFTKNTFFKLKEDKIWEYVERLFAKYRKLWVGPDAPVYIFPSRYSIFDPHLKKNGFTLFPDKIFLFLPPLSDKKEVEALFVHEYHHATRIAKLAKPRDEYTLLDSLIMEGLAEMAVAEYVGKPYVASWNTQYPDDLLTESWHQYFKENLSIPITNPVHDQLLYGNRIGKAMIGYALGYFIIRQYKRLNRSFSITNTFRTPSEQIIKMVQEKMDG